MVGNSNNFTNKKMKKTNQPKRAKNHGNSTKMARKKLEMLKKNDAFKFECGGKKWEEMKMVQKNLNSQENGGKKIQRKISIIGNAAGKSFKEKIPTFEKMAGKNQRNSIFKFK